MKKSYILLKTYKVHFCQNKIIGKEKSHVLNFRVSTVANKTCKTVNMCMSRASYWIIIFFQT